MSHAVSASGSRLGGDRGVPPLLVLDLDGTLVDTVDDLTSASNRLLASRSLPSVTRDEVRAMIGDGVPVLVQRLLASRSAVTDEEAVAAFQSDYAAHAADASRLFPGIARLLDDAHAAGWRLAVCTNKPEAAARGLLAALGVAKLFDAIGGGDSFATRKPDPAHLLATIAAAGSRPDRAVMVGDHRNDVLAAEGAEIPAIFVQWGYGSPDMRGAAAGAANPSEILPIAGRLLGGAGAVARPVAPLQPKLPELR